MKLMIFTEINQLFLSRMADQKMDRDEVLVKIVEHEAIIWKRNHPQFKNVLFKEQAWGRVAYQLGISSKSLYAHTAHSNIHNRSCIRISIVSSLNICHCSQSPRFSFPKQNLLIQLRTHTHVHTRDQVSTSPIVKSDVCMVLLQQKGVDLLEDLEV